MFLKNEVGLGVLQSSVQEMHNLQKFHTTITELINNQLQVVCAFGILATLVSVGRWAGALQARSRFQTAQIAK